MKRTLLITLAGMAAAHAAEPTAAQQSRYAIELGVAGNFAVKSITSDAAISGVRLHTYGADLTGVRYLGTRGRHALTLRLGYATGSAEEEDFIGNAYYTMKGSVTHTTLRPGYRYSRPVAGKVKLIAGVHAGLSCLSAHDREEWGDAAWVNIRKTAYGLAYAAEVGFSWKRSAHVNYFIAYQFGGSTARPTLKWSDGEATYTTRLNAQQYHSVRIGVSYHF